MICYHHIRTNKSRPRISTSNMSTMLHKYGQTEKRNNRLRIKWYYAKYDSEAKCYITFQVTLKRSSLNIYSLIAWGGHKMPINFPLFRKGLNARHLIHIRYANTFNLYVSNCWVSKKKRDTCNIEYITSIFHMWLNISKLIWISREGIKFRFIIRVLYC